METLDLGLNPPPPAGPLTPSEAARLYRDEHWSVCQIAAAWAHRRITRAGVENRLRTAGIGGNMYCPLHRRMERLDPFA